MRGLAEQLRQLFTLTPLLRGRSPPGHTFVFRGVYVHAYEASPDRMNGDLSGLISRGRLAQTSEKSVRGDHRHGGVGSAGGGYDQPGVGASGAAHRGRVRGRESGRDHGQARITLITGDRVVVDAKGRVVGF